MAVTTLRSQMGISLRICLGPDGGTVFVSDTSSNSVFRVDLATGTKTLIHQFDCDVQNFNCSVQGITFDSAGNL
jgi:sugar lactone lactonase YvrE